MWSSSVLVRPTYQITFSNEKEGRREKDLSVCYLFCYGLLQMLVTGLRPFADQ